MRINVIEDMVCKTEKAAKDSQLTDAEYTYALALLIMEQMQGQSSNPMSIKMAKNLTLVVGLKVDGLIPPSEQNSSSSTH